ncbi:MAG: hypothetical protein FWC85_02965 [Elusimicrobia bacterium]|nr:hypothetical protein [Elusimicrobiota bacterium]
MKINQLGWRGSACKRHEQPSDKKSMKRQTSKARRRHFKIHGENSSGKLKELTKGWLI